MSITTEKKILTLCIVYQNRSILLGMKKRGFGAGRWNGFGGKVHERESIEQAALRELHEEAGIIPHDLKSRGLLTFHFTGNPIPLQVHLFSVNRFDGKPIETEEMKPRWFMFEKIPYTLMWPDDRYWLPLILKGKNIQGTFFFKDTDTLESHSIDFL